MTNTRTLARLLGLVLVALLAGCGGGQSSSVATGQASAPPAAWSWGEPRITDPTGVATVTDAEGASVLAAPGQLLVTFRDDATPDQIDVFVAQLEAEGGEVVGAVPGASLLEVQFGPDADLADLERRLDQAPGIEVVCPNEVAEVDDPEAPRVRQRAAPSPSPTPFSGSYWMTQIGLQEGWKRLSATAPWPGLAIVDGGTKALTSMVSAARLEIVDGQGNPMQTGQTDDDHLSRVTALAGADPSTSTWGVAYGSRLYAFDVETPALPTSTSIQNRTVVTYARIVWTVDRALQKGCRVVNLSLGPPVTTDQPGDAEFYSALQHFRRNLVGVVGEAGRRSALICIASGNETKKHDDRLMPGNEPVAGFQSNVLIVASNGPGDPRGVDLPAVVADANEGAVVNITAPGEGVSPGPAFPPDSGTSYSSPIVAGAAAVVMQAAPRLSASEVRRILLETASPNVRSGSGLRLLDVNAAVTRAQAK